MIIGYSNLEENEYPLREAVAILKVSGWDRGRGSFGSFWRLSITTPGISKVGYDEQTQSSFHMISE